MAPVPALSRDCAAQAKFSASPRLPREGMSNSFPHLRGWRAEKRKPMVSALPFGKRGGRLSVRHMRSYLSALPRFALLERKAWVGYRASRDLSARRSFRALRAHVISRRFGEHRASLSVWMFEPGPKARTRERARWPKAGSANIQVVSQLLAGTRSGPRRSPDAARVPDARRQARGAPPLIPLSRTPHDRALQLDEVRQ
jgi:hypothetical protein